MEKSGKWLLQVCGDGARLKKSMLHSPGFQVRILSSEKNAQSKKILKQIYFKLGLMPCLKTILNCYALEHSAFKTKHFQVS